MFHRATTQAVSRSTIIRAKEKLLIDSFEIKLSNITRTESCVPDAGTRNNHETSKVDKRIRLLEAKIDNLCRLLAKMNK